MIMTNKYNLFLVSNGEMTNISDYCDNYSWGSDIEELAITLTFDIVPYHSDDRFVKRLRKPQVGDKVIFDNYNREIPVFEGMVTEVDLSGRVTCMDYGFFLNQSEGVFQFKNITADSAIKQVLKKSGMPYGKIPSMSTRIKEIYVGRTFSDVIKEILEQVKQKEGRQFMIQGNLGQIEIVDVDKNKIRPLFKPADNVSVFNPLNEIKLSSHSFSISDLVNRVEVVSDKTKTKKKVKTRTIKNRYTAEDKESRDLYGTITKVVTVSDEEKGSLRNIAENELKPDPIETLEIETLGDDKVRAGHIIELNNKFLELYGDFLITKCDHTYKNNTRVMKLTIERR